MVSEKKQKTLVLLDTHAILHRAFHALPELSSPSGEPTGALYGLASFVIKALRELKPDYIVACYDLPQPTFRHAAYDKYKATRPKMDDVLAKQIGRSRDILKAFGIPIYDSPGFEADDILGTISSRLSKEKGLKIIIASGDLDTLQLVEGKKVLVYTLKKGVQETVIYDENAVKERYGFGPELVPDFKGLKGDPSDNIIGVKGIGDKTATDLIKNFGSIENIYKKLKKNKDDFIKAGIKERIINILLENEEEALFSKTLAEIRKDAPIDFNLEAGLWNPELNKKNIEEVFRELGFKSLAARLENGNLGATSGNLPALSPEEEEKLKVAFWLLDSNRTNPEIKDIISFTKAKNFSEAESALLTNLKKSGMEKLYKEVELPLTPVLKEMEKTGVLIDVGYLKNLSKDYHRRLEELEKKIWKMAGEEFNINSPQQMSKILFEKMGLGEKRIKKTSTGAKSTGVAELMKMKEENPIIAEIISYRELAKLTSTYVDNLPNLVDKDGRLHTAFVQTGTTTGRISSKEPNLQNIPIRSEFGKNVRRAFVAEKGFKLADFDYSQIELRMLAIMSGDEKLKRVFKEGVDVHSAVSSEVFGVKLEDVTEEMRRRAKVINFGIIYGMGINALRQNLNCTREEAEKFYNNYFSHYKKVAEYIENAKAEARRKGYTETILGRKRYFPQIKSPIEYIRKEAERMAVNAPLQGGAADLIKMAMISISEMLEKEGLKDNVKMVLQIHDELLFEIKEDMVEKISPIIGKKMEGVYNGEIPIVVNISIGDNWEDVL